MKILTTEQKRQADLYTIENEHISAIDLMERAAQQCTNWILQNLEIKNKKIMIFVGTGNNGGDGLAIARQLCDLKTNLIVEVYLLNFSETNSTDNKKNLERLENQHKAKIQTITNKNDFPHITKNEIVIDSIFGSGLSKPIKGVTANIIDYINETKATIISIDIPSGLFGEENHIQKQTIVKADITLTFQMPYLSFFFRENYDYVGDFYTLPIGLNEDFINQLETPFMTIETPYISREIKKRKKFSHKGDYGHGFLIAGSLGKMGAALMSAKSCHRTGIGLLTVHTPKCGQHILQAGSPETMLSVDQQEELSSEFYDLSAFTGLAIGPGIGLKRPTRLMLKVLIETYKKPIIFDADAITIIGDNKDWLNKIPKNSIFTPHPKEFERIAGVSKNHYQRNISLMEFAQKYGVYVVFKGAFTRIACPDGTCYINTTGNPGMATGGSGDVLTGMILSLLSQGYTEREACRIGVYLHGLAGDIAAKQFGTISMIPSDIINNIYKAYEVVFGNN